MEELSVTSTVFVSFFIFGYRLIPNFKSMKSIIIFFELIISFIFLSKNFYKKHSLYSSKFQYIQTTDFYPIKTLYKTLYENGEFKSIEFDRVSSNEFSLIQTQKYSKQCFNNHYIQTKDDCPIIDIKSETKENNN